MRSSIFAAVLAVISLPIVSTAPSLASRQDVKEIIILVQVDKATSGTNLRVLDKNTSQVVAKSCSKTIDSGDFAKLPITITLDDTGAGSLEIGSTTYTIHEDVEISGGITCGRMYNDDEVFVSCDVALPFSFGLSALNQVDIVACSASDSLTLQNSAMIIMEDASIPEGLTNVSQTDAGELRTLEKRQGSCGSWTPTTVRVGDGNPHQNYWHQQLSENMNCGAAPSCSVGQSQSQSFNVGWTSSASASGWISGGFSVTWSWVTGNTYNCNANRGDTVCVWYNTAHTAYTVQNAIQNTGCGGQKTVGDPFVMFSPNNGNSGGGYYCVIGAQYCRSQGQAYWDKSGRAGGP